MRLFKKILGGVSWCEQSRVYSVMGGTKSVSPEALRAALLSWLTSCLQIKQKTTRIGRLSFWRWGWPSRKKGMLWWFLLLAVGSLELQQSGRNIHSHRRDVKMMHSPFLALDCGHFWGFVSSIWPLYPARAKLLKLGLLLKLFYQVVSLKSRNAVW